MSPQYIPVQLETPYMCSKYVFDLCNFPCVPSTCLSCYFKVLQVALKIIFYFCQEDVIFFY